MTNYQPTKWMNVFLSSYIWVPVANISLTFYLWHISFMSFVKFFTVSDSLQDVYVEGCPNISLAKALGIFIFDIIFGFGITFIICILLFAGFEKPAVDARRVYKRREAVYQE